MSTLNRIKPVLFKKLVIIIKSYHLNIKTIVNRLEELLKGVVE